MVWSYDGATLMMTDATTDSDWDVDCGNLYMTGTLNLVVPISAGASLANIGGNMDLLIASEFCGDINGAIAVTGNMNKR